MTQIQLIKISSESLAPATTEVSELLRHVKTGAWLNCDNWQPRNYLFHKRFFALFNLSFECWTPAGRTIAPAEKQYLLGYVRYRIPIVGNGETHFETEQAYTLRISGRRANGHAIVKCFDAFLKWATIEDGFHEVNKAVFNVIWNHILFIATSRQDCGDATAEFDSMKKVDLRKAARRCDCQIRIPGVCNGNPVTSVIAHYRLAGRCGTGIKPDDHQAAISCKACHDLVDGREKLKEFLHEESRLMYAEGIFRTQEIWRREGFI